MEIRGPIRNERDYEAALGEIEELMDVDEPGPDADKLEVLSLLVKDYEEKTYPIEASTPSAVLEFYLEQKGIAREALEKCLGSSGRVSDLLTGKRSPSLPVIVILNRKFGIPMTLLIDRNAELKPRGKRKLPAARSAARSSKRKRSR